MGKSTILFIAAATFFALAITTLADKPADNNGMPSGNGFSGDYHYDLNIFGGQGDPTPEYVNEAEASGNITFIPRDQGNGPVIREISL